MIVPTNTPERAATVAGGLRPERHPHRGSQALYWVDYARAMAQLWGRRNDEVMALWRAELISPHQVEREPLARDFLGGLVERSQDDTVGRELRGRRRGPGWTCSPIGRYAGSLDAIQAARRANPLLAGDNVYPQHEPGTGDHYVYLFPWHLT